MWGLMGLVIALANFTTGLTIAPRKNAGETDDLIESTAQAKGENVSETRSYEGGKFVTKSAERRPNFGDDYPKLSESARSSLTSRGHVLANVSQEESTTATQDFTAFFTTDVITGIAVIGGCLLALLITTVFLVRFCRKSLARRKMKRFQNRKNRKGAPDDTADLLVAPFYDVTRDDVTGQTAMPVYSSATGLVLLKESAAESKATNKATGWNRYSVFSKAAGCKPTAKSPSPPKSTSSAKSSLTVLENLAYEDLITSTANDINLQASDRIRDDIYDVAADHGAPPSVEYENINRKANRRKRAEHAYETIKCSGGEVKIVESAPAPIQIKRHSKSEEVTIFPCAGQFGSVVRHEEDGIVSVNDPFCSSTTSGIPESLSASKLKSRRSDYSLRSSICIGEQSRTSHLPDPSPYLLRTWSAPHSATSRSKKEQEEEKSFKSSKDKNSANISGNRKEKLAAEGIFAEVQTGGKATQSKGEALSSRPRVRRRAKRKVRSKRRHLDERRRKRLQWTYLHGNREHLNAADDPTGARGQNRWPLPGIYFDSSSGSSSSEVFKFKTSRLRGHKVGFDAREATLLEDIWCHLDEITQKERRTRESHSSRRDSVSLSSSSEIANSSPAKKSLADDVRHDVISPDSTSDRGYFTYKHSAKLAVMSRSSAGKSGKLFALGRPRVGHLTLSTLTSTSTWRSSSATQCSSISSSIYDSLLAGNASLAPPHRESRPNLLSHFQRSPYNPQLFVPQIVLSIYDDERTHTNYVTLCREGFQDSDPFCVGNEMKRNETEEMCLDSYLPVLESYLNPASSIYEELSNYSSCAKSLDVQCNDDLPVPSEKNLDKPCLSALLAAENELSSCKIEKHCQEENTATAEDFGSNVLLEMTSLSNNVTNISTDCSKTVCSESNKTKCVSNKHDTSHFCKNQGELSKNDEKNDENCSENCDSETLLQSSVLDPKTPLKESDKFVFSNKSAEIFKNISSDECDDVLSPNTEQATKHCVVSRAHVLPEKTTKNYVVVAPSLLLRHCKPTSSDSGLMENVSTDPIQANTVTEATETEEIIATDEFVTQCNDASQDEESMLVFMEMRV